MKLVVTGRSRLPDFTELAITADEEGKEIIEYVSVDGTNPRDKEINLYRNDFHLHYPAKRP